MIAKGNRMNPSYSSYWVYWYNVPIGLTVIVLAIIMADKKNDILSESDKQRKVWKRVEKLIAQDKAEDALLW